MRRFLYALILVVFACDSSAKVGEVRPEEEVDPEPAPVLETADAATSEGNLEWRLQSPLIPCSIYALEEVSADAIYAGCKGGRIYRFDGVDAQLVLETDEGTTVSLLHGTMAGEVWAGAQTTLGTGDTTQLYRFDGKKWSKVGSAKEQITSLAGHGDDLWLTTATEIRHYESGSFVTSYTAPKGRFHACTFAAADRGYCVGTHGLAVVWNGTSWSALSGTLPWTSEAEVFGVEIESYAKRAVFVFGERIDHANGDFACRAARLVDGAFTTTSSEPCFAEIETPRKRTGTASSGFDDVVLFSVDDSYGTALAFDLDAKTVSSLCGPSFAFTRGQANTRAAGPYGFLATVNATGDKQLALDSVGGTDVEFRDFSVGSDGSAWARIESSTSCGSISNALVRYEEGAWAPIPAPQGARSGRGLAALSHDRALTFDVFRDVLLSYGGDQWVDGPIFDRAWSLAARAPNDVWVGGTRSDVAHFDGTAFTYIAQPTGERQVEAITIAGSDVWMMQQGYSEDDTDEHLVRWADGKLSETSFGIGSVGARMRVSALDATHVYASGSPAQRWDGKKWNPLPFSAHGVWMRAPDEVFFIDRGDIWRWDGKKRTRVYHGVIPISQIAGSKDRGFAIGPGGMTIVFQSWPNPER